MPTAEVENSLTARSSRLPNINLQGHTTELWVLEHINSKKLMKLVPDDQNKGPRRWTNTWIEPNLQANLTYDDSTLPTTFGSKDLQEVVRLLNQNSGSTVKTEEVQFRTMTVKFVGAKHCQFLSLK